MGCRVPRRQTPETDRYLRALVPPDDERRPVPSGAYNVAARLLAVEAGADTRHVAERMFLSEHTVQDHLKSIFAKSGTRNRRTLIARAAGR